MPDRTTHHTTLVRPVWTIVAAVDTELQEKKEPEIFLQQVTIITGEL
jgi:hypothetical protein